MTYTISLRLAGKVIPTQLEILGDRLALSFPYFAPLVDEVKSMEGKEWDAGNKIWTVANTKRNLYALDYLMKGPKSSWYKNEIFDYWNKNLLDTERVPLGFWKHQVEMFNFIMTRHRCLIAGEMRTGKTRPALMAIHCSGVDYALWVGTTSALRGVSLEARAFRKTCPSFKANIDFTTYDSIVGRVKRDESLSDLKQFQFVVFDECQKLKTHNSQRTESAKELSEFMEDTWGTKEFVIGLSGTPAPKDPTDWWSTCEVIRPGFLKEGNWNLFKRRLAFMEQREGAVGNMYWHLLGWNTAECEFLYKRLKPLVSVFLKKDCLDLPPKIYKEVELTPSKSILATAKAISKLSKNTLDAINKLRQLSDGFQYNYAYSEEKNVKERIETTYIGSPKLEQLKLDIDEHEDTGRLIVYAGFQGSIDKISELFLSKGWIVLQVDGRGWNIMDPESFSDLKPDWYQLLIEKGQKINVDFILSEFNRATDTRSIPLIGFVAQTESAGTGLELSSSPTIIYYSNSNNGDGRMQSEDRAHSNNMDKNRGLTIIDYIHLPTDRTILNSLQKKRQLQAITLGELSDALTILED
jgi:hypothetical protein